MDGNAKEPVILSGILVTRACDQAGEVVVFGAVDVAEGDTLCLSWGGGSRCGATVAACERKRIDIRPPRKDKDGKDVLPTERLVISFNGGEGVELPSQYTAVNVCVAKAEPVDVSVSVDAEPETRGKKKGTDK